MPSLRHQEKQGPWGGAGLIRYFDVEEGGPQLDPKLILGVVVAVIILELMSTVIL